MYYDKRIRYLSYYESGIKLQNAGYVKFQVRDSLCQMIIYMKGSRLMGSGEAKVYLLSEKPERKEEGSFYSGSRENDLEKHLLGNLSIRNGQGHCAVRMDAENMADSGLRYDEICGIRIELHEYQYLESRWAVTNFMPKRQGIREDKGNGYRLRQPQNGGGSNVKEGKWQRDSGKDAEVPPVEVNLIVTPVSENLRVEKLVREEPAEEMAIEEIPIEEVLQETPERLTAKRAEIGEGEAAPRVERISLEEGATAAAEERGAEGAVTIVQDDEESMQEMLEREVLREEAKGVRQKGRPEGQERSVQPGRYPEKGMPRGREEAKMPGMRKTAEEITLPEQELQTDKWEQLKKTYPIVHPIREDEEYLKIAPRDFVIFTEKYQELVHNSFLLHGYYNYKHLILGKKERDGKAVYYLGVPGTFHEREKTVAVMFGFEAFDGKREPAENGDFGYYLRRVEI